MITLNRIVIVIIICINAPAFCMENNTSTPKSLEKKRKKIVRFQSEPDIIRSPHHQRRTSAPDHVLLTPQEIQTLKEALQQEKKNSERLKELSKNLKLIKKSKGGTKTKVVNNGIKTVYCHDKKGLISSFYVKVNLTTPQDSNLNKNMHPEIKKLVEKHEQLVSVFAKNKGALVNQE